LWTSITSGDVMKSASAITRMSQAKELIIAGGALVLLLSAGGLTLVAQHAREQGNVTGVLLALHLAFWSYVLGIAGLVLVPMVRLIGRFHMPVKRQSMSRYASVEPRRENVEQPEIEATSSLQRDVAPVVRDSVFHQRDDRYKATSSTKVA